MDMQRDQGKEEERRQVEIGAFPLDGIPWCVVVLECVCIYTCTALLSEYAHT